MKYATNTKIQRNQALYEYYLAHPELSLQEIGQVFGISRERVRQIILKEKRRVRILKEVERENNK